MLVSYHNHSTWSDGTASIALMVASARDAGCAEFGISDHYVPLPSGEVCEWSMELDRLDAYCEEALRLDAESEGITVRLGLELDYFPEQEALLREVVAGRPFDYVIGSVHYVDTFPIDSDANDWEALSPGGREAVHRGYWERLAALARLGCYDIAAHLDLTKKFGFRPEGDLADCIDAALDALAEADMALEINTAGWHKPCEEAYPTVDLLRRCRERGIPTLISSDAHTTTHVTRDFDRATEWLAAAGYDEVARFRNRKRWLEPLEITTPLAEPY